MLDIARNRPGAELVNWILGDSRDIGRIGADLVLRSRYGWPRWQTG